MRLYMPTPVRSWIPLRFGKHRGLTLPQVVVKDPDWFFWACEEGALEKNHSTLEAQEVERKARTIIPKWRGRSDWRVEYSYLGPYGCFGFELVEPGRPTHEGGSI